MLAVSVFAVCNLRIQIQVQNATPPRLGSYFFLSFMISFARLRKHIQCDIFSGGKYFLCGNDFSMAFGSYESLAMALFT